MVYALIGSSLTFLYFYFYEPLRLQTFKHLYTQQELLPVGHTNTTRHATQQLITRQMICAYTSIRGSIPLTVRSYVTDPSITL